MRLLIIEDEKALASALKTVFEKNDFQTDTVHSGTDGFLYAKNGMYDAIILDVLLPGMNGFEVLQRLRQEKNNTPVIMLTAKNETENRIAGLESGADDYLGKPFDTGELLARVRALLRRKGNLQSEDVLEYGDLSLNLQNATLKCGTSAIQLGKKEFGLARLFLENSRQIITKEQINTRIWGLENDAEYNSTEVYISFLRKKLNFIKTTAEIKTMRGMGYMLE